MRNNTDYRFPEDWGLRDTDQKCVWYCQYRAATQAARQETPTGRLMRRAWAL